MLLCLRIVYVLYLLVTSWTIIIALYVPYCPDERELPYGFVKYSVGKNYYSQTQLVDGVKKRFRCFKGYSIRGVDTAECIGGSWSAPAPDCMPDPCSPLAAEANNLENIVYDTEVLDNGKYMSATTAHITCSIGMTLVYGRGMPICNAGEWVPEIPLCLRNAAAANGDVDGATGTILGSCELPSIWAGTYSTDYPGNFVREGTQVFYECDDDYAEAVTETPVTCFQGRWHPGDPDCIEKGCALPSIPSYLTIEEEITDYHVDHGTWLHFHCIPGYRMSEDGFSESKCWYGEWETEPPLCVPDDRIDFKSCGRAGDTTPPLRGRIVGGFDANPGAWPWQAGIWWQRADGTWFMFCAGSVISEEWILSAGHCFAYDEDIARLQVRVGVTNQETDSGTAKEQIFFIDGLYLPKGHDFIDFDYDIGLLHVVGRISFNPFVRPICLPPVLQPEDDPEKLIKINTRGMVIGWGHGSPIALNSSEGTRYEDQLQQLEVPIRPRRLCERSLRKIGEDVSQFSERLFCAGYTKQQRDTCFSDSGGPLMRKLRVESADEPRWVQIGIVSAGKGCAVPGMYAFYTHVPKMMSWVQSVLNGSHTPSEHDLYQV
ncbi:LOW QUALITY PROTEIN: clotting factor C-like [Amphiura filiformis]|uniref:LOW QUALITY PROTEIN: clotting factor C-like n=1 Tax=Amphiura filiformis TaxID=82378 RepID=UPI003B217A92